MARANCVSESGFINDATPSHVDDAQIWFCFGQNLATDNSFGLFVLRQVHGNEITLGNHFIKTQHFNAHLTSALFGHEGIVSHESHAKCKSALSDQLSDATETDHPEGFVGEFDAFPFAAFPTTCFESSMGLGHIAR